MKKKIANLLIMSIFIISLCACEKDKYSQSESTTVQETVVLETSYAETAVEVTTKKQESDIVASGNSKKINLEDYVGTWYTDKSHSEDYIVIKSVEDFYYEDQEPEHYSEDSNMKLIVMNFFQEELTGFNDSQIVMDASSNTAKFSEKEFDSENYINGVITFKEKQIVLEITESTTKYIKKGDCFEFSYYDKEVIDSVYSNDSEEYILHYGNFPSYYLDLADYIDKWKKLADKMNVPKGSDSKEEGSLQQKYYSQKNGYAEFCYEIINGVKHFDIGIEDDFDYKVRYGTVFMEEKLDNVIDTKMKEMGYQRTFKKKYAADTCRVYKKDENDRTIYVYFYSTDNNDGNINEIWIKTDYEDDLKK